jgi:hypothetical protein
MSPIRASGYIYGSGYVRLVRFCFIFGFMLIFLGAPAVSFFLTTVYILYFSLIKEQDSFSPLFRTQKNIELV